MTQSGASRYRRAELEPWNLRSSSTVTHPLGEVGGHVDPAGLAAGQPGSPAARKAAPRASAAPAPCWWPGPTATGHPLDRDQRLPGAGRGLDDQEVVTAEGLARPDALHPVQREMADRGGSQCGYCTPGFICSMAAEYYRPDRRPAAGRATGGRQPSPARGGRAHRRPSGRAPTTAPTPPHPGTPPTTSTGRTASTCTRCQRQPVPVHRLPPDQGRRLRARRTRTPPTRCSPGSTGRPGRGRHQDHAAARARSSARPISARRSTCSPTTRTPAGRRLHRLGRRAEHPARPRRR